VTERNLKVEKIALKHGVDERSLTLKETIEKEFMTRLNRRNVHKEE